MSDNTENPNVTGNTDLTTAQSVSSKVGVVTLEEELKNQDLASDDLLKQVEAVLGR